MYEGIFHSLHAAEGGAGVGVVLKMARPARGPADGEDWMPQRPVPTMLISGAELAQLTAADVHLAARDVGPVSLQDDAGGFGTDSAISRGKGGCAGEGPGGGGGVPAAGKRRR